CREGREFGADDRSRKADDLAARRRSGAVRDRPLPQALLDERTRRHRPDPAKGRVDRLVRGEEPARPALALGHHPRRGVRMPANRKVLVLAGDGIGPEIMRQALRVIEFFDRRRIAGFEVDEGLVGGAAYDASGVPLTDETLAHALASDAVLFGA